MTERCPDCEQRLAEATALASALAECATLLTKEIGHGYIWQRADKLMQALDHETMVVLHLRRALREWGSIIAMESELPIRYDPPMDANRCSCPCHVGAATGGRCCLHRPIYTSWQHPSELGEKTT